MEVQANSVEVYFIDFGNTTVYYQIIDDGARVISRNKSAVISRQKLLDYIATAKELGHKTGKL